MRLSPPAPEATHPYGAREVERLLGLSRSTLRSLVAAGFVTPARGHRNAPRFSFRDLIVLRTAKALADAHVPPRRIIRSVRDLRARLPDSMPLSGLSIGAVGERVVVKEGSRRWRADSGQYLLAFEGDPAEGSLSIVDRGAGLDARGWFDRALALESKDPEGAFEAYSKAIELDPKLTDARLNLGLLLHQAGRLREAERVYRDAIKALATALLFYNLGVLLEDLTRPAAAVGAYQWALRLDPGFADAHYNLALLLKRMGRPKDAIRHMAQYRKLTA